MLNCHNCYYVKIILLILHQQNNTIMVSPIIHQATRMCGNSFIYYMLDTRTNKRFYTVYRSDSMSRDFKRIDAAKRFALYL